MVGGLYPRSSFPSLARLLLSLSRPDNNDSSQTPTVRQDGQVQAEAAHTGNLPGAGTLQRTQSLAKAAVTKGVHSLLAEVPQGEEVSLRKSVWETSCCPKSFAPVSADIIEQLERA